MQANTRSIKHACVSMFFLLLLLIGAASFKSYGIAWDEPIQRVTGGITVKYIGQKFAPILITEKIKQYPDFKDYGDSDYGVAFEAPAVILEQLFRLTDDRDVFMMRHLLTFLVFVCGVFAVYRLATRRFDDWRIGLLAAGFLVLTPRFFAESFYNSKDIVFMAAFAIAMNTMIVFVEKPGIKKALLHALATAFATDIRIMAVALFAGSIAILLIRIKKNETPALQTILLISIYSVVTYALIVAMFPWLWSHPFGNFIQAFRHMSRFRWDGSVRYLGGFVPTSNLPWHYSLCWISITTPLLYLGLFVIGMASTLRLLILRRFKLWSNNIEMQDIVFLVLFFAPILSVIFLHSVLYDGWRQLYFVYPALLLVAIRGWLVLWDAVFFATIIRVALCIVTLISATYTAYWIWNAHPMQNVYFNALAGHGLRNKFDLDYWGLGNRKALEYILAHDKSPRVNIREDSFTPPIELSSLILRPEERSRLNESNDASYPLYVLTNYRNVVVINDNIYSKEYSLFYELRVADELILSVYKRVAH